jgi:hypothetical protein
MYLTFYFQWAEDTQVEEVQNWLGLNSYEDCMQLSRDAAVAVLRIMLVFRYDATHFFRGLWRIPPSGIPISVWDKTYGDQPALKSGKGVTDKNGLCMRVAHYLGLSASDHEVAAPEVAAPEVAAPAAANPTVNTSDLEILLAALLAEKENRSGIAANEVTSECTGAAPANPPSNGTQG